MESGSSPGVNYGHGTSSSMKQQSCPPRPVPKPKLKLSCDSCAKLKVGCPKQQPECERCVNKGRRCTYSSANRYGKKKREQEPGPEGGLPSPPEHFIWQTPLAASDQGYNDSRSQTQPLRHDVALLDISDHALAARSSSNNNSSSSLTQQRTCGQSEHPWSSPNDLFPSIETCDDPSTAHAYREISLYQTSPIYYTPYVNTTSWPPVPSLDLQLDSPSSHDSDRSSDSAQNPCHPSTQSVDASQPFIGHLAGLRLPTAQETCLNRICNLFQSLKRPKANFCIFRSQNVRPPCQIPPDNKSIEDILSTTDDAIEQTSVIMRCPCSKDSSFRCTLLLVLCEVISCYEHVVKLLGGGGSRSPCSSDEGYTSAPSSNGPGGVSSGISVPTIMVGTLKLDRSDATNILAQLILSRIKRVREMVEELSKEAGAVLNGGPLLDSVAEGVMRLQKSQSMLMAGWHMTD